MTACELERFMEKVDRSGDCWLWTAGLNAKGYGAFYQQGTMRRAHRVAFEHFVGPVPEGLELDHSCRNRACVNPAHLRVVTTRENVLSGIGPTAENARKTHCKRGHEFTPENTHLRPDGSRTCRACWSVRRRPIRAVTILAALAVLATVPALFYATALQAGEPVGGASSIICDAHGVCTEYATVECPARTFAWGLECWSKKEGPAFVRWLQRHGASPHRFRERHPEQAQMFAQPWPPVPYWKACVTGEACAEAVIQHVFGSGWRHWLAIAGCETGWTYDRWALGDAGERGWFQIHPMHFGALDEERLWDVRYNTRVAFSMSSGGSNDQPWTCARYV